MPLAEIEYPLTDARVGLSFPAGGEYDPSRKGKPPDPKRVLVITCRLFDSAQNLLATSTPYQVSGADAVPWAVTVTAPGPGPYPGCTLKAYIDTTEQPYPTTNLYVGSGPNKPGGQIVILPA